MSDSPFALFDIVASIGGLGGVLALVVFYYARKDALTHKSEWVSRALAYHEQTKVLLTVVQNNTEAVTKSTGVAAGVEVAVRELRAEVTELRKVKAAPSALAQPYLDASRGA